MTQSSYYWNGMSVGDAALSPYTSDAVAILNCLEHLPSPSYQGVIGRAWPTAPGLVTSPGGTYELVSVSAGLAMVNGRFYYNSTDVTLAMATSSPNTWWVVVLRSDKNKQTIRLAIKGPYISEAFALSSMTQTEFVWEIPLATAYQNPSPVAPTVYDHRYFAIKMQSRSVFVPALGGYDATHGTDLSYISDMGVPLRHTSLGVTIESHAVGQFCIPNDFLANLYVKPCFIPLGVSGDVYIEHAYGWGAIGDIYNLNWYDSLFSTHTITNQVVNTPFNYHLGATIYPVQENMPMYCFFDRKATDASDTFTGTIYFTGWLFTYDSYYG